MRKIVLVIDIILLIVAFPLTYIFYILNTGFSITDPIPKPIEDFTICNQDSDCIVVDASCCGCSAGGSSTAINQIYRLQWREKQSKECKNTMCLTVISPGCGSERAQCLNNECVLIRN